MIGIALSASTMPALEVSSVSLEQHSTVLGLLFVPHLLHYAVWRIFASFSECEFAESRIMLINALSTVNSPVA